MFFRTGEFARMLSVEKSVLIYYDRIGLFCPVHVDGNGYRCYSAEQTRDFHFIRLLRDLGLSLDEIAAALSARDAASLEALFQARASALDREIARLTALRSRLSASVEDLEHIQLSPPEIVFLPEKALRRDRPFPGAIPRQKAATAANTGADVRCGSKRLPQPIQGNNGAAGQPAGRQLPPWLLLHRAYG